MAAATGDDYYERGRNKAYEYDSHEDDEFSYQSYARSRGSGHETSESGSESSSSSDHDETGSSFELGADSNSDDGEGWKTSTDRRKMGKEGEPYTKADLRISARYIASIPDWDDLNHREKWEPFAEEVRLAVSK
jgi:hypothetical protein